jgi:hypothetical protein
MLFIYVNEIQEEEPMEKKHHWKRGKETYTGIPTLIYILHKIQGKKNDQRERSRKKD